MALTTLDFRDLSDEFTIHYGVPNHSIESRTFANSLIALTNGIKVADSILNPGFQLEITVEAIGPGSFKIKLNSVHKSISNIFSASNIKAIVLGLVSAFLYDMINDNETTIIINDDSYILETGNERIVLPKEAEKYYDSIKKSETLKKEVSNTFRTLESDKNVEYLGIASDFSTEPIFVIPRNNFPKLSAILEPEEEKKEVVERTQITIVRAILEKSFRRWQFVWNGIKISAPIIDVDFYSDFTAHKITIAPGDALDVELRIIMTKDPETNIFINSDYEVVKVHKHLPSSEQLEIEE